MFHSPSGRNPADLRQYLEYRDLALAVGGEGGAVPARPAVPESHMIEPIGSSLLQAGARRQLVFAGTATIDVVPA